MYSEDFYEIYEPRLLFMNRLFWNDIHHLLGLVISDDDEDVVHGVDGVVVTRRVGFWGRMARCQKKALGGVVVANQTRNATLPSHSSRSSASTLTLTFWM